MRIHAANSIHQKVKLRQRSNHALELTATRRVFTFYMIETVSVPATLSAAGGGRGCSR